MTTLDMEKIARELVYEETISMLGILAQNLTSKMKLIIAPDEAITLAKTFPPKDGNFKLITFNLRPFFGMYVGYDLESDILVCRKTTKAEMYVHEVIFEQTHVMLQILSKNFSINTKIVPVQKGTKNWPIIISKPAKEDWWEDINDEVIPIQTINVPLQPFFGMFVGYNSEFDILPCWSFF